MHGIYYQEVQDDLTPDVHAKLSQWIRTYFDTNLLEPKKLVAQNDACRRGPPAGMSVFIGLSSTSSMQTATPDATCMGEAEPAGTATVLRNHDEAHHCRVCTKLHGNTSSHNTKNDLSVVGSSVAVNKDPMTLQN